MAKQKWVMEKLGVQDLGLSTSGLLPQSMATNVAVDGAT